MSAVTSPCFRLFSKCCLAQLLYKHLSRVSSSIRLRSERMRSSFSKKRKKNMPKTMEKPLRNLTNYFPHGKQMAAEIVK